MTSKAEATAGAQATAGATPEATATDEATSTAEATDEATATAKAQSWDRLCYSRRSGEWPNAQATMRGNSSRQNGPPCVPGRSAITTSAPASRRASAHLLAFSTKNGSSVPAT